MLGDMENLKRCTGCASEKPLEAFHRSKKTKDGRVQKCAQCAKDRYEARPVVEPAMDGEQRCWDCGVTKHVTEFPKHKRWENGRHGLCKGCHSRRERQRRLDNPEVFLERRRTIGKASELRRRYGITLEQYAEMVANQNGGCAICGATDPSRRLAVDHDWKCCPGRRSCGGCVRGLLCLKCNTWLSNYENGSHRMTPEEYLATHRPKGT